MRGHPLFLELFRIRYRLLLINVLIVAVPRRNTNNPIECPFDRDRQLFVVRRNDCEGRASDQQPPHSWLDLGE